MKISRAILLAALAALLPCADAAGAEPAAEQNTAGKLKYNLFNPTPDALLRPFNADRPSKTDSPITVDAGRLQLEADGVNYTFDRYNAQGTDTRVQTLLVAPTFLRLGLSLHSEVQVLVPTYQRIRTDSRDVPGLRVITVPQPGGGTLVATVPTRLRQVTTVAGYGDMLVRVKINLAGNEGGDFSAALIPLLKAPTASRELGNGRVEGGLSVPLASSLPAAFSLFGETRLDLLYNGNTSGYHALFTNTLGLARPLPFFGGKLSIYGEFFSAVSSRSAALDPLQLTADVGLIYQLTPNLAVDVNSFFGLTRGAPDLNIFAGVAMRF